MIENPSRTVGTVFLVGAGPGHPGLITRLGYELLQHCDAVAYDALIPMELISSLPERVERYYVGKRAAKHSLPQSKINELLAALANRGLNVVRLKGGDPSIFGRSGEEAEFLTQAGIPVVTIPGVTAASAAAAMSGFSLTNRQSSSWIFLATGHGAESSSIPVPWDQMAALPGGTLVIYMGLAKLEQLVSRLISSGLAPETPAVVVQAVSTGMQMSVEAPLKTLTIECKRQGLKPPALIIIGEAIRNRTADLGNRSTGLKGKRILVTSPPQKTCRLCRRLREEGAEPIPYPTASLKRFDRSEEWLRCLEAMENSALCIFSGDFEVHSFFDVLLARGLDLRSIGNLKIIACCEPAGSALFQRGIRPDEAIESMDLSTLKILLSKMDPDETLPLIWPCNSPVDSSLELDLSRLRASFIPLAVAKESTAVWESHWSHELASNPPDYIVFTGIAETTGFFEILGDNAACRLAGESIIAAADIRAAEALRNRGVHVQICANAEGEIDALVTALINHSKEQ